MYSALRALVLQPFSYPNQGQVVQMWPGEDRSASPLDFLDIKEQASSFRELGAYTPNQTNLGGDNSQAVRGARCTAGVLRAFGVAPAAGRILETSDEAAGAPAVAVISNGLWRRAFAADPGVVGRVVPIDGVGTTIVGVMPAGFEFASPWYRGTDCEIWTPLRLMRDGSRADGWLACVGRLKDWIAIATADAEVKAISGTMATGRSHTTPQAGAWCSPSSKSAITHAWKKKKTDADPTEASGRISRGNDIFFTRPALVTITLVAACTPVWNRFQASRPENKRITKFGIPFFKTIPNTTT